MNQQIKQKWVSALRSGRYKQGKTYLNADNCFCVMGVLCDIAVKAGVGKWKKQANVKAFQDGDFLYRATFPDRVRYWAGFSADEIDSDFFHIYIKSAKTTISSLNDEGMSFNDLADLIEKEL